MTTTKIRVREAASATASPAPITLVKDGKLPGGRHFDAVEQGDEERGHRIVQMRVTDGDEIDALHRQTRLGRTGGLTDQQRAAGRWIAIRIQLAGMALFFASSDPDGMPHTTVFAAPEVTEANERARSDLARAFDGLDRLTRAVLVHVAADGETIRRCAFRLRNRGRRIEASEVLSMLRRGLDHVAEAERL